MTGINIDISSVSCYQRELRKADNNDSSSGRDGVINSDRETLDALKYILNGLDISNAPQAYQKALRRDVDAKGTPDGVINPTEVDQAVQVLLKTAPIHTVLAEFASCGNAVAEPEVPVAPPPEVKQTPPPQTVPEIKKVEAPKAGGRYAAQIKELRDFLMINSGDKPNASKTYTIDGKKATMIYHVFENNPTHLQNGGATTSEAGLFMNFGALYMAVTGDSTVYDQSYNFIRYYMMPHDGWQSPQMPDSKLTIGERYAGRGLTHWLIILSDKGATGDVHFGSNICYEIYEKAFGPRPSIALAGNGLPDTSLYLPKDNNTFKFSSALDADQWFVDGYYFASTYSNRDYSQDIAWKKASLIDCIMTDGPYKGAMKFGKYWGGNVREGWGWKSYGSDLYAGYQDPGAWAIMGDTKIAKAQVAFLAAAQAEFEKKYGTSGPFMPVYSEKGVWGWEGADPNTDWAGFQFRAFAHLAQYYYMTGDPQAKQVLTKFISWVEANKKVTGTKIDLPSLLVKNSGQLRQVKYSPHNHGLYAQGLIWMAAKGNDAVYRKTAESLLDDLVNNRKDKRGAYVEPNEPVLTYGFHQAEVGIALCLYQVLLQKK